MPERKTSIHIKAVVLLLMIMSLFYKLYLAPDNPRVALDQRSLIEIYCESTRPYCRNSIRFYRGYDGMLEKIGIENVGIITFSFKNRQLLDIKASNTIVKSWMLSRLPQLNIAIEQRFGNNSTEYFKNNQFLKRLKSYLKHFEK